MLSSQEDQTERRRVLANDARVREQGSTYLAHTTNDTGGRFAQIGAATIVGADPIPKYPAASSPWAGPDLVGPEPPLAYENPALEPQTLSPLVEAQASEPMSDACAPSQMPSEAVRADVGSLR